MHRSRQILIILVVAILSVIAINLGEIIYRSYLSERDYLLGRFVLDLVEDYTKEHGDWPRSWRDLEEWKRPEWGNWPEDSPLVKSRIAVDFQAKIADLAGQDVDQFRAVQPIQPHGLFDDHTWREAHITPLLATIRRLHNEDGSR